MSLSRIKLAFTLSFAILLVLTGAVFAKPNKDGLVQLEDATVPWEVPALYGGTNELAYECSDIPAGLVISPDEFGSDRLKKGNVMDLPQNGGRRVTTDDTVSGTASDQHGGSYRFLYKNRATYNYDGQGVVSASMVDTFRLQGGDVNYTVVFNWRWQYEAPDGIELAEFKDDDDTLVNLDVSPKLFATEDGFNENPNIIPGSWWQVQTNGFIFGCDPI